MKLIHWSADIVTQVHGRRQESLFDQAKPDRERKRMSPLGKPHGFWLSDESRGAHGWKAWCKAEGFRPYSLRYEHEVKLSPKAKILYLRTAKDIDEFADKYGSSLMVLLGHERPGDDERLYGGRYIDVIDWKRVAKKYHGIIITPYIWEQRLGRHMWYYGWDCASGCIWNARAIESITMVREYKAPRKPTRWELKRKHKRDMQKMREMREATEALKQALPIPRPFEVEVEVSG